MSALRALLEELIDYAGLFPPAALGMARAVEAYAAHRKGPESWMLGRFVVPVARLDEFGRAAAPHLPESRDADVWRLSALIAEDPSAEMQRIVRFNDESAGRATIDAVELKAAEPAAIEAALAALPEGLAAYVEVPISGDTLELLRAIAVRGARAKVRTGGLTPEAFPDPAALARFLVACREAGCAFKATAGLHHPVRSRQPLTYAADSPQGVMHGFLNLFAAATLAHTGASVDEVEALLREERPGAFVFDESGLAWRSRRLASAAITEARRGFALGFGSCSFSEPTADLGALGFL